MLIVRRRKNCNNVKQPTYVTHFVIHGRKRKLSETEIFKRHEATAAVSMQDRAITECMIAT